MATVEVKSMPSDTALCHTWTAVHPSCCETQLQAEPYLLELGDQDLLLQA